MNHKFNELKSGITLLNNDLRIKKRNCSSKNVLKKTKEIEFILGIKFDESKEAIALLNDNLKKSKDKISLLEMESNK